MPYLSPASARFCAKQSLCAAAEEEEDPMARGRAIREGYCLPSNSRERECGGRVSLSEI